MVLDWIPFWLVATARSHFTRFVGAANVQPKYRWIAAKWEEILLFQRLTESPHQGPMTGCEIDEQLRGNRARFSGVKSRPQERLVTTSLVTNSNIASLPHFVSRDRIFLNLRQLSTFSCQNACICMEIQVVGSRVRMAEPSDRQRKVTKVTFFSKNHGAKNCGYFSMLISNPELYRSCTFVARCRSSR